MANWHSLEGPAISCRLITLSLLSAQGKEKIELFVGDGAGIWWEVHASH